MLYMIGAIALVLLAGWAVYVLPTPGPLSPWQLTGAMVPALGLVLAAMLGVGLLLALVRLALGAVEMLKRRAGRPPR